MSKVKLDPVQNVCLALAFAAMILVVFCTMQLTRGVAPWYLPYIDGVLSASTVMVVCVFCVSSLLEQIRYKTFIRVVLLCVLAVTLAKPALMMLPGAKGNMPQLTSMFSAYKGSELLTAANAGDAVAQLHLGLLYANGVGDDPPPIKESRVNRDSA